MRPPVSRSEAISIASSEYDTTSNYCGFSTCPSIDPRPLVVESARIEAGRRHADACPTEALTRDTTARVWAVVMRFAADPGRGRIWLIDERSGEILCSSEYDTAYRSRVHE
jgi:hypothetical protein